jgi:hypothetical protein
MRAIGIYNVIDEKVKSFKLPADSASLAFACHLKSEYINNIELDRDQQADIFMNSLFIHFT